MEDIQDNLPTEGKRYYMSHVDYYVSKDSKLYKLYGDKMISITQLVCASNKEKARQAVTNSIELQNPGASITRCRIDYLIVGD